MASWSWRSPGRARETQAPAPLRRPVAAPPAAAPVAVPAPVVIPPQTRPAPIVPVAAEPAAAPVDPSPDAHLRRALALVELSRLVLDAD